MNKNNPVEKELKKLDDQWQEFIDTDKPILHWKIKPTDSQLINTFVKLKEQFDEKSPDLFIHLVVPFSDEESYTWSLSEEVNRLIEEGLEDSAPEEGEDDCHWQRPKKQEAQSPFQYLLMSCDAILKEFGGSLDSLVLVIAPPSVKQDALYRKWWDWVCCVHRDFQDWPSQLKLVVFDGVEQPFLQSLEDDYPEQLCSVTADLNYKQALQAVLAEADDGTDAAKVRQGIFDMQNAIAESDGHALKNARAMCLPVADGQQWFDLSANITMTCAAGLMSWQHYDSAIKEYRNAQTYAQAGCEKALPGCDKLLTQAMLNEATCLFLKKEYEPAAKAYEATAQQAKAIDDVFIELEAWRMGSFAWEQNKQSKPAWDHAKNALDVGKNMPQDQRQQSSLPFVGDALLRMSPNAEVSHEVESAMIELMGDQWRDSVRSALS